VTRTPGHPEEFPYIDIWQTLAAYPPPWLKKCFEDNCKIMMARATNIKKKKKEREKEQGSFPSALNAPQYGGMETSHPGSPTLV
jgi:hypothetical protein